MKTRDEIREQEMARGREVAAKNAVKEGFPADAEQSTRLETLRCYEEAGKIQLRNYNETPDDGNYTAFCNGHKVASERFGPAYPSESFMANCALAVGALAGYEGIPEKSTFQKRHEAAGNDRQRKDEARTHVYNWKNDPAGLLGRKK